MDSGEISLSGLQIASFLLCLHVAFLLCTYLQGEREREISLPVLIRTPFYWTRETLLISFNLNDLHKGPIAKYSKGIWASTYESGRNTSLSVTNFEKKEKEEGKRGGERGRKSRSGPDGEGLIAMLRS